VFFTLYLIGRNFEKLKYWD